jgi:pimeloyl-ACP methyl ester carboxylesterase
VRHHAKPRPSQYLAALALSAVVSGCGLQAPLSSPSVSPSQPPSSASVEPSSTPAIVAESVDIGDGRSLYLVCRGEGSPTVLFEAGDAEAGDAAGASTWDPVAPGIGRVTRACAYDRAGVGRSSAATGCRRLPELVSDLARLIEAANVPGPYVLVAASGGGYISSSFAALHPDEIAGMVFLDVAAPYPNPPPELVEELRCDNPANIERRDYLHVENDAWDHRVEIGDIPITIISVDYGDNPPDPGAVGQVQRQLGWLVMSPQAEQLVVTHTGHAIVSEDPALALREVVKVVTASRGG